MSQYLLASHAFMCVADGHAIFLDLRRDKYTALDVAEAQQLGKSVRGWPVTVDPAVENPQWPAHGSDDVVAMLLSEGLLTRDWTAGKEATPCMLEPPVSSIVSQLPPSRITAKHALNFVIAWLSSTYMLGKWPLERIVRHVQARARRYSPSVPAKNNPDSAELAALYCRLQPHFFSPIDACLRNSLTLIEFMARYRHFPAWVFGVRFAPFAAHSWVQDGSVILNDSPEHVRSFTPIMVVQRGGQGARS